MAVLNDYDIRVVETDEVFLALEGSLTLRLDDGEITLGPGQLYVVRRGVQHQPVSTDGAGGPHRAQRDRQHRRHA